MLNFINKNLQRVYNKFNLNLKTLKNGNAKNTKGAARNSK